MKYNKEKIWQLFLLGFFVGSTLGFWMIVIIEILKL